MTITFDHVEQEAEHIATYYFAPERLVQYTAGQFVELSLEHPHADNRGRRRWFTLSSSPTDELVSITTKHTPKAGSSFKKALQAMLPGDQIQMSDAMGDFVLPKLIQTPLIFVAGGIGITPFHSMLTWLHHTNEARNISLLYGVHSEEEIIFQNTITSAGVHATIIVDQPAHAWGGQRGMLTADSIIGLEPVNDDALIYVSGPEPMVEQLEQGLLHKGVKKHQLVLDFFPNYVTD
ncbi:MAG: FAD-dependent oxidoreductase [Patescibacteria group bacterium]|nr:FAD-dependent oxidoreductase [Patescibacteria group bacterium]